MLWLLSVTQPCCCGPCESRITTGAKIVFLTNISVLSLLLLALYVLGQPDLDVAVVFTVLISIFLIVNLGGVAGLRKNGSFLPVPDTWRQSLKLRDKYQWCLLVPWIILYGLLTGLWSLASVPACAALASILHRHSGDNPVAWVLFFLLILVTLVLPYQLSVVIRCAKLVKKGGQHYVVPDTRVSWARAGTGDTLSQGSELTLDSRE